MRLDSIFIMLIVGTGVTIGFMEFALDLTAQYNIADVPEGLKTSAETTLGSMNETANTMMDTFAGRDNSWVQTSYNIFFALPVQLINTFANTVSFGANFGTAAVSSVDAAGGIVIPAWITAMVLVAFMAVVIFGLWSTLRM